jgi:hypothetical protein
MTLVTTLVQIMSFWTIDLQNFHRRYSLHDSLSKSGIFVGEWARQCQEPVKVLPVVLVRHAFAARKGWALIPSFPRNMSAVGHY